MLKDKGESLRSFHHVDSEKQSEALRLGSEYLYP